MHLSLAALKKWRVKWCIANESNTGSACEGPWQRRARLCIIVLLQCSPVLVRMAYFYCKGCAHLLTFLFFLLSFPEGDNLPERLSNLGIATRSTRLVPPPPHLPSGSIRLVVQSTSQQRWSPAVCDRQTRVFPLKNNNFTEERKKQQQLGDVFAVDDSYMTKERDDCIKTVHQIIIKQYHTRPTCRRPRHSCDDIQ